MTSDNTVNRPEPRMVDEYGYAHIITGGVVQPRFLTEEVVKECQADFHLRDGDVVICTYPKCGTTWMQQIVLCLLHGGDKSKVKEAMFQAPWIEWVVGFKQLGIQNDMNGVEMSAQELNGWDGSTPHGEGPVGRRAFKTHAVAHLPPWSGGVGAVDGKKKKCIIVARNPKDTAVSMYHHTKDMGEYIQYTGDFDHFLNKLYLTGNVEGGSFWNFYAGWERVAEKNPGYFYITYEEMKRDPIGSVRRIAEYIEVPCDDEMLKKVVGASTFDAMKAKFADIDKEKNETGRIVKKNHIRKGCAGTWRQELFGENLAAFEAVHAKATQENALKAEWDYGDEPAEE